MLSPATSFKNCCVEGDTNGRIDMSMESSAFSSRIDLANSSLLFDIQLTKKFKIGEIKAKRKRLYTRTCGTIHGDVGRVYCA